MTALQDDYRQMQIGFIYAEAPSFDEIMEQLQELQMCIRDRAMKELGKGNVTDEQVEIIKHAISKYGDDENIKSDYNMAPLWICLLYTSPSGPIYRVRFYRTYVPLCIIESIMLGLS